MLATPPLAAVANPALNVPGPDLLDRLAAIVGPGNAIADPADQVPYLKEWRDLYAGRTPLVLRPGSTEEVSAILSMCNQARVGIVPQGGNTGLVGGQIPHEDRHEILLSLSRMNRIRHVDPAGTHMVAEAGLTLLSAQLTAETAGRLFPLSLASEGTCQIGGVMASNAGGIQVLAYGNARNLALGIEAVLADGSIIHGLRALKKDNTGYDLKDLLIGSEGTLGVITAVALKLFPRPAEIATAFVALSGIDAVAALFQRAEAVAGSALTAFEFLDHVGLDMVLRHGPGTRDPFASRHPWYALLDVSGGRADGNAGHIVEHLLTEATEEGLLIDATIAGSLAQRSALWKLREALSEAQKPEGGSIKHDISVPVSKIPDFIQRAGPIVQRVCPGARPVPFGHFGDGNVHYNVSQPQGMDKAAYLALWHDMADAIHGLVHAMGGSISAEHGIGRLKREDLVRYKSPAEIAAMRAIKTALDPHGIMNPAKVV